jgi:hypothetical protein
LLINPKKRKIRRKMKKETTYLRMRREDNA